MTDPFNRWALQIVLAGLFLIFIVHFGKFVYAETWPTLEPLVDWLRHLW